MKTDKRKQTQPASVYSQSLLRELTKAIRIGQGKEPASADGQKRG